MLTFRPKIEPGTAGPPPLTVCSPSSILTRPGREPGHRCAASVHPSSSDRTATGGRWSSPYRCPTADVVTAVNTALRQTPPGTQTLQLWHATHDIT